MMKLIGDGIDRVRVFELAGGLWADGEVFGQERLCLVRWRSQWNDKFYQVYVNGRFAGVTIDVRQRGMVVGLPSSFESAVVIEVFAVEEQYAYCDLSNEIEGHRLCGRVVIYLLRSQSLGLDWVFEVYSDGGMGEIDYDSPVTERPIEVWPSIADKAGFGLSRFGESDFGRDWSAGVGFGVGCFGEGEFGVDSERIEWVSGELEKGAYRFAVKLRDRAGSESEAVELEAVTVVPGARSVEKLSVKSFEKQINSLELITGEGMTIGG